jgi:UDP-sugar transporter A1/2/3
MQALGISWRGWAALATFTLQNGCAVLIMRWCKTHEETSPRAVVFMQEAAVKLPICVAVFCWQEGGVRSAWRALASDLARKPREWAQLFVPAFLYSVQNTLMYVGYANVEAAIGQVMYQTKIMWTALFSVVLLKRKLSHNQWLALGILALGVLAVEGISGIGGVHTERHRHHRHWRHGGGGAHVGAGGGGGGGRGLLGTNVQISNSGSSGGSGGGGGGGGFSLGSGGGAAAPQSQLLGLSALVGAAVCTAFASVYFEKMLKHTAGSKPDLWLRNLQLTSYASAITYLNCLFFADETMRKEGWLSGFGVATWLSVVWQALGGLLVAITVLHADNILRGFAQAFALIVGAFGSWVIFDFHPSWAFAVGVSLVISAVFLYGSRAQTPAELCDVVAATGASCAARVSPAVGHETLHDLSVGRNHKAGGASRGRGRGDLEQETLVSPAEERA